MSRLPATLDPLQFAYRPNRYTDDAISAALHRSLTYLENKNRYVRMLFIDFSSAFNTVIPQHLRHNREHSDQQPPSLVWQLHHLGPEISPESGEDSRENHQNFTSIHIPPILTMDCSAFCPL
ncbi:hypothetical protein P4O66_018921, partial [Electrophorus voltai]